MLKINPIFPAESNKARPSLASESKGPGATLFQTLTSTVLRPISRNVGPHNLLLIGSDNASDKTLELQSARNGFGWLVSRFLKTSNSVNYTRRKKPPRRLEVFSDGFDDALMEANAKLVWDPPRLLGCL